MKASYGVQRPFKHNFISKVLVFILVTIFLTSIAHTTRASTSPRDLKLSAIERLSGLQGAKKKEDKAIQKAISHIQKSLADRLWEDPWHLVAESKGKKVFHEEHKAAKKLEKIANSKKVSDVIKNAAIQALEDLISADSTIAETAISEASVYAGTSKKVDHEIEKAERNLAKAQQELDKGGHAKAIKRFENAWKHAQLAIKFGSIEDDTRPVVTITSPKDGETISRHDVLVEGTITNPTGNETGGTVNGIVATVYGNQFVANHVPLQEGENTITATATDTDGNVATTSINVNAVTTRNYIRITAETESGISPLETILRVEGSFSFTESSVTYTGPDKVEFLESTSEEYRVRITREGIYYFTAEVTDTQNNIYTDTIAIVVLNQTELDALLKAKWNGMKTCLINSNIEGALNCFYESSKEDYQKIFNLLIARLPDIASAMREIEMIYLEDKLAKYRIKREEVLQGQTYDITYYIYFIKNFNGLWHIESF